MKAQIKPKIKMTTPIPPSITAPDSVETRIGALKFFDGFPEEATSFCFLGLYASPNSTLTEREIETRFVRKFRQKQDRRNDGKKEISF